MNQLFLVSLENESGMYSSVFSATPETLCDEIDRTLDQGEIVRSIHNLTTKEEIILYPQEA